MAVLDQIKKTFRISHEKQWYETYWAFDIHGTILKPSYNLSELVIEFYPYAKETLQLLTKRPDITMILYTCSYPHEVKKYQNFFVNNDIMFSHVNSNPGISSNMGNFGFYEEKFYFNVLFEDKAGFDPSEWKEIYEYLKWCNKNKYLPQIGWTTKY